MSDSPTPNPTPNHNPNPIHTTPEERLLPLLSGVVELAPGRWKSLCPVHEADGGAHDPSLSIDRAADGKLLLHCFACPATGPQICMAVGLTQSELYPDHGQQNGHHGYGGRGGGGKNRKGRPQGKKVAEYEYRDSDGVLVYVQRRYETDEGKKTFLTGRYDEHKRFIPKIRGVHKVLYRLPELIAADKTKTVFVVEGEKKVEALMKWGQVATCNLGGAGKWNKEYAIYFRGRAVVVLPDNDDVNQLTGRKEGFEHARKILESLSNIAASVHVLELPGLPPKGDIIDWIAAGGTLPQLLELTAAVQAGPQPKSEDIAGAVGGTLTELQAMDPLNLRLNEARTDIANGRRLIRKHGSDLRYCHPWGKWLVWDGKRWNLDETAEVARRAKSISDDLWREIPGLSKDVSDEVLGKILAFAKYTSSSGSIQRMLTEASSEPGAQVMPAQLDADPWILNCQNGTVDLTTGNLRPHAHADMLTKISPVEFDPDATCPVWERFIASLFGGDEGLVGYVQRLCGYWLTGVVREQILPILHGSGANGKTTFLNTIMDVIGPDYVMKAVPDFLMAKRHESHPTDKADLFGKRFVACSETEEGRRLAESLVKELTGAEKIRARRMREDFWEFNPTHKIALVTNHRPTVSGTDRGIWRRLRLVPFEVCFWDADKGETGEPHLRQDKTLADKLRAEHVGILTWVIRGTLEWQHDGEKVPEQVQQQTGNYRESQDTLGVWMQDCCTVAHGFSIRATELYASYKAWCELSGEFSASQKKFGLSMTERGFDRFTSDGTWYRGITLIGKTEGSF